MKDKNIEEELNKLSPFLSKIKKQKKEISKLPKDYFINFEDRLMHRIAAENALQPRIKVKSKKRWLEVLFALFKPSSIAIMASCILLLFIGIRNYSTIEKETSPSLLAKLSLKETKDYLGNHVEDLSIEEITSLFDETDLNWIQKENLPIIIEAEKNTNSKKTLKKQKPTIQKVLESTNNNDLLQSITEEDLESYELF